MDATRMTTVIKELMKLLQNMSESGGNYDKLFCKQKHLLKMLEDEVEEIKEELGSWYIADYTLYQGS